MRSSGGGVAGQLIDAVRDAAEPGGEDVEQLGQAREEEDGRQRELHDVRGAGQA